MLDSKRAGFYWIVGEIVGEGLGDCIIGVIDEWRLTARSVLLGDFTDKASGNTAKIERLWPLYH